MRLTTPGTLCVGRYRPTYDGWDNVTYNETPKMGVQPDFTKGRRFTIHRDTVVMFVEARNGMLGTFLTPAGLLDIYFHELNELR
jgi:hypothetical protein